MVELLRPVLEAAAVEAAKAAGANAGGVVISGSRGVLELLRRAFPSRLPPTDATLRELVAKRAAADPEFLADLLAALADGESALRSTSVLLPPADFVDRDEARTLVREPGIHLIAGDYGVGKSAFVAQVAEDVAERYPTGRVYVDLDLFRDEGTLRIPDVERSVLAQLGVELLSDSAADLHGQYLAVLIRCRCVLIIENVVERTEAFTLAPPLVGSLVLVTTRRLSDDLLAWSPSLPTVLVGVDDAGGRELLSARCGPEMLAAEPEATAELLNRCDHVPYYLRLAGARLARRRGEPGAVAAYLRELGPRLPGTPLDRTFREISPAARAAAAVLAHHPGPDFTRTSAKEMLGDPNGATIDELVDALVVLNQPGGRLRLFRPAWSHFLRAAADVDLEAAFDRVLAYYLGRALAADRDPGRLRRYHRPEVLPAWPDPHVDPVRWLGAEAGVLVDLVHQAHRRGRDVEVTQLCGVLEVLFTHHGFGWLCVSANDDGVRSAERLHRPVLQARILSMQARILTTLHAFDRAEHALVAADALLAGVDDDAMRSTLGEFRARWREETGDLGSAIAGFQRCIEIDRHTGNRAALGIHLRMLANVLVKAEQAALVPPLLDEASRLAPSTRNAGRIATVHAKALAALHLLGPAKQQLAVATDLFRQAGATQYDEELTAIDAEIALRSGDTEHARTALGELFERTYRDGHPRSSLYLSRLNQLPPASR